MTFQTQPPETNLSEGMRSSRSISSQSRHADQCRNNEKTMWPTLPDEIAPPPFRAPTLTGGFNVNQSEIALRSFNMEQTRNSIGNYILLTLLFS